MKQIYLDNAATTQPIAAIKDLYDTYANDGWYNPSALYAPGVSASAKMDIVRKAVLSALKARTGGVIFTSGGTESNNIAIMHAVESARSGHFVTSAYEHASVYQTFKALERAGHSVTFIRPNADGIIDSEAVSDAVTEKTSLVSVMHVNNETGALNDINAIAEKVRRANPAAIFHADGVQGFLKVPFAMGDDIDFYSISAHKIGGLKGTGALYVRQPKRFRPYFYGGAQENGLRAGTENTFGIAAFGAAVLNCGLNHERAESLRNRILIGFSQISDIAVNSPLKDGLFSPYIVNLSVLGVHSETLLHALEADGIWIGTGSACSSHTRTSRIHDALGLAPKYAQSAIRISIGADNTQEDIDCLIESVKKHIKILRQFKRR